MSNIQHLLAEETPFILEFDDDTRPASIYTMELSWGADPMDILMAKQEIERDELAAYLAENTRAPRKILKLRRKTTH